MLKWSNGAFKRGAFAVAVSMTMAACDMLPIDFDRPERAGEVAASPNAARAAQSQPAVEPGRGRTFWRGADQASRDGVGMLRISQISPAPGQARRLALAFAGGVTAIIEEVTIYAAEHPSGADGASFSGLFGVEPQANVYVYQIVEETVTPSAARRGGLCGAARTRHLAVSEFADAEGDWVLRIAAFAGEPTPGGETGDPALCAVYRFVPG